jgi:uncharacterized protein
VHTDLHVRLTPRVGREALTAAGDGFAARVRAPPVDGRANEELLRLVATRAGVPRGRVELARGDRARQKVVRVHGVAPDDLRLELDP